MEIDEMVGSGRASRKKVVLFYFILVRRYAARWAEFWTRAREGIFWDTDARRDGMAMPRCGARVVCVGPFWRGLLVLTTGGMCVILCEVLFCLL